MIKAIYDPEMNMTYVVDEHGSVTDVIGYYFGEPNEAATACIAEKISV